MLAQAPALAWGLAKAWATRNGWLLSNSFLLAAVRFCGPIAWVKLNVACSIASVKAALCTEAVMVPPLELTARIVNRRPDGAAVHGAIASTSPTLREAATVLAEDIVIVEPFDETTRLLIPAVSRTLVVFGMIVE